MSATETLPFPIGQTFFTDQTVDNTNNSPTNLGGKDYWVEDVDHSASSGAKTHRSGRRRRLRVVKNDSGITLLPKRVVRYSNTAGERGTHVDGYTRLTAEDWAGVVDEFLPSTGVADGDWFYIAVEGPAVCLMPLSQVADITVGTAMVALTAVTSGSSTSGAVAAQDISGATQPLAEQVMNLIGRAMSTVGSASTGGAILVDLVGRY